jgi:hypothetical protein
MVIYIILIYLILGFFVAKNYYKKGFYTFGQAVGMFFFYPLYYFAYFLFLFPFVLAGLLVNCGVMIWEAIEKIGNKRNIL